MRVYTHFTLSERISRGKIKRRKKFSSNCERPGTQSLHHQPGGKAELEQKGRSLPPLERQQLLQVQAEEMSSQKQFNKESGRVCFRPRKASPVLVA